MGHIRAQILLKERTIQTGLPNPYRRNQKKRGPWRTTQAWEVFDIEKAIAKLRAVSAFGLSEKELFYKGKQISYRCQLESEWQTFFGRDYMGRRMSADEQQWLEESERAAADGSP